MAVSGPAGALAGAKWLIGVRVVMGCFTYFKARFFRVNCLAPTDATKRRVGMAFGLAAAAAVSLSVSAPTWAQVVDLATLSFVDFERMALDADPQASAFRQRAAAARDRAVAAERLPDPTMRFGTVNVPIESFSLTEEEMTMVEIGYQQAIPPYGALTHGRLELEAMADSEERMAAERELAVLRGVRQSWLELYYQFQAVALIQKTQQVFDELVKISTARYRAGRGKQQEVVRAEMELGLLQDRVAMLEMDKDMLVAELGKWLGAAHVERPAPVKFPELPPLPTLDELRAKLRDHPMVDAAELRVKAARERVEMARADYRPETMFDLAYGQRSGRGDMVTAMVSFSVPIFTSKRQDRKFQASRAEVEAARDETETQRRDLQEMLEGNYRRYTRLSERLKHFEQSVLPFTSQYAQSTLTAYQAGVSDFEDQVMARMQELDNSLEALRLKVDKAKAHATLLYIAGDRTL